MRRSDAHAFRQAYNAQAVVCAEGSQLIVTTGVVATSADAPSFASTVLSMENTIGLPKTVLADTGYANGQAVRDLRKKGIDPLVAIGRPRARRPYDFRPPPENREPRRITEPWRLAMKKKLETTKAGNIYRLRKQTVEPVFGIIKSIMGFRRFSLRGLAKVTTEWTLVALAYNCKRMARLQAA
ncbi:transposase [Komagataeibacter intermedius AF2]|uniref:Transposase n=1 Tax=Komagataeibacter intermedius AF2 TaxID=1458464 RepID=A0A0N1F8I3_9PROT|nr:transposase [Komagataeibacter intermedius AF2]